MKKMPERLIFPILTVFVLFVYVPSVARPVLRLGIERVGWIDGALRVGVLMASVLFSVFLAGKTWRLWTGRGPSRFEQWLLARDANRDRRAKVVAVWWLLLYGLYAVVNLFGTVWHLGPLRRYSR